MRDRTHPKRGIASQNANPRTSGCIGHSGLGSSPGDNFNFNFRMRYAFVSSCKKPHPHRRIDPNGIAPKKAPIQQMEAPKHAKHSPAELRFRQKTAPWQRLGLGQERLDLYMYMGMSRQGGKKVGPSKGVARFFKHLSYSVRYSYAGRPRKRRACEELKGTAKKKLGKKGEGSKTASRATGPTFVAGETPGSDSASAPSGGFLGLVVRAHHVLQLLARPMDQRRRNTGVSQTPVPLEL